MSETPNAPAPAPAAPVAAAAPTPPGAPVAQAPAAPPPVETLAAVVPPVDPNDKTEPGAATPSVVPERYDFKAPEGVKLDDKLVSDFSAVAKELGLSQDAAQRLMDLHTNAVKTASEGVSKSWETTNTAWIDEVKSDPVIGGDNLVKVQSRVSKLIDQHGDPKFREALNFTGAGNNPAVIRTLDKLASLLTEGGHIAGQPAARPKTHAEAIYGVPST